MIKVLFVCLGNICRSPTAQGVFEKLIAEAGLDDHIYVDSAGTSSYHVGESPDPRAQRAARKRGIDLSRQRSRQVVPGDCREFDYILAMDRDNLRALRRTCPEARDRMHLFLDFAPHLGVRDVPDPYYGGSRGFEHVLDLIEEAGRGLLEHIKRHDLNGTDGG
ncbi:MAG: low molecular weight phosphotyrosine protein phosphatase [Caldilineae bacterium]|nr:MAG: low molecular weight phosphotyrosine protein phosphatase [Caldilineae bacterium]